ncbi:hypothetical protein B0H11DRAFT_2270689 [Mycena galericulata]|nr:hypothetical protein B0H11DRAFT_2270689 [Mycena galericulata]
MHSTHVHKSLPSPLSLFKTPKTGDGREDSAHAEISLRSSEYQQTIDYLRAGGTLMAVGLPGRATLEASIIFFTVFKSISILGSYVGNRQDAAEALDIAVRGQVECKYALKKLGDLASVYEGLTKGEVAGRIVLEMPNQSFCVRFWFLGSQNGEPSGAAPLILL